MASIFAVLLCWASIGSAFGTTSDDYVSDADAEFQQNADLVAEQWCVNYPVGTIDIERGHRELERGVGGHNFFLDSMSEAESPGEVGGLLLDELHSFRLYIKAFPIVLALLLCLLWMLLCCTVCCKAQKKRSLTQRGHTICNVVATVLVSLVLAGVIACTWAAAVGSDRVNAGLENMLCSSAKFVNTTFAGRQGDTKFLGILPTLLSFDSLERTLNANSTFLARVDRLLEQTSAIDRAVRVASGTLQLLQNTLEDSNNQEPKSSGGASLYHQNLFSLELPAALTPTIEALNGGIASALAEARAEAQEQLSEQRRRQLQETLHESIRPLVEQKDSLRLMLQDIVDPDARSDWWNRVRVSLKASTLGVFMLACLTALFAVVAVVCCSSYSEGSLRRRRRLSCCGWCCSMYLAINAFLVGGLMLVVAVPASGGCLVMDDIDSVMLHDIAPAIPGLDVAGDTGIMISDMLDQCINPSDPSVPANLLDILFLRNETTGEKATMREMFIESMKDQIESKFATVAEQMAINVPRLAEDPRVHSLRNLLTANPADKMILPMEEMRSTAPYIDLFSVPSLAEAAFRSSAACSSHTVIFPGTEANGTELTGIADVLAELEDLGSNSTLVSDGLPCTQTVICRTGLTEPACNAGNALMSVKAELQGAGGNLPYRCNLFSAPHGPASAHCDVTNMTWLSSSIQAADYEGDCLQADGTMIEQSIPCDLADFTRYLAEFDSRINIVLERMDYTVEVVKTEINVTLRKVLEDEILQPLDELADSMNCNFLGTLYDGVVQSMCYQSMHGFRIIAVSYVCLGFIQLILIAVMYAMYRRSDVDVCREVAPELGVQVRAG